MAGWKMNLLKMLVKIEPDGFGRDLKLWGVTHPFAHPIGEWFRHGSRSLASQKKIIFGGVQKDTKLENHYHPTKREKTPCDIGVAS